MFAFSQSNKSATDCVSSTALVVVVVAVVVEVVGATLVVVGGSETKTNNISMVRFVHIRLLSLMPLEQVVKYGEQLLTCNYSSYMFGRIGDVTVDLH